MALNYPLLQAIPVCVGVLGLVVSSTQLAKDLSPVVRDVALVDRDLRWSKEVDDAKLARKYSKSAIRRMYGIDAKRKYPDDSRWGRNLALVMACSIAVVVVAILLLAGKAPHLGNINVILTAVVVVAVVRFLRSLDRATTVYANRKLYQVTRGSEQLIRVPERTVPLRALVGVYRNSNPAVLAEQILSRAWVLQNTEAGADAAMPLEEDLEHAAEDFDVDNINAAIEQIRPADENSRRGVRTGSGAGTP